MSGTNNFVKKYFLSTNWDNTNFHHFCKVRACRYSFKNSIFQKLPKIVEKHFFWWVEQIILQKIFSKNSTNWDNTNFHHFCKVRACRYSFKNSIFQKMRKLVEKHFFWWVEQIILPKNIFLAQIEIIQIFTIFVRSAPVDIPSKIQFSKNCLKLWRNTSFDEWNK